MQHHPYIRFELRSEHSFVIYYIYSIFPKENVPVGFHKENVLKFKKWVAIIAAKSFPAASGPIWQYFIAPLIWDSKFTLIGIADPVSYSMICKSFRSPKNWWHNPSTSYYCDTFPKIVWKHDWWTWTLHWMHFYFYPVLWGNLSGFTDVPANFVKSCRFPDPWPLHIVSRGQEPDRVDQRTTITGILGQ